MKHRTRCRTRTLLSLGFAFSVSIMTAPLQAQVPQLPPVIKEPAPPLLGTPVDSLRPPAADTVVVVMDTSATVLATLDLRRPLVMPAEYRSTPWIQDTMTLRPLGRLIALGDPTPGSDILPQLIRPYDKVILGELRGTANVGDTLLVVQRGRGFRGFGYIQMPYAMLRVDSVTPSALIATVREHYGEARIGDLVVWPDDVPDLGAGELGEAEGGHMGTVIGWLVEQGLYRIGDIGFIDIGANDGLHVGDELEVFLPRRPARNETDVLPPTHVAEVRVIRVEPETATVRVLTIENAALAAGLPVQVIRIVR